MMMLMLMTTSEVPQLLSAQQKFSYFHVLCQMMLMTTVEVSQLLQSLQ